MSTETMWIIAIATICLVGVIVVLAYRHNERKYADVRIDIVESEETVRLCEKPMRIQYPIGH